MCKILDFATGQLLASTDPENDSKPKKRKPTKAEEERAEHNRKVLLECGIVPGAGAANKTVNSK
jgi:hypothetical protein